LHGRGEWPSGAAAKMEQCNIFGPLGQGMGMIDAIRDKVTELLDSGQIKGFLGLVRKHGHIAPHLFQQGDDLGEMSLGDDKIAGDAR